MPTIRASAFEKLVDRLLASPAYGQRWARHWLDVARYADYYDADPKTRTASCELTEAWRYRDWVVECVQPRPARSTSSSCIRSPATCCRSPDGGEVYPAGLIATTFLSNGVWDRGDADKEKIVSDMVDDQIDTVGKAFLGLTLGCARCHDHKFDPVSQEDYYALAGIFYSTHILQGPWRQGGRVHDEPGAAGPQGSGRGHGKSNCGRSTDVKAKLAALDKKSPKPPARRPDAAELSAERDRLQRDLAARAAPGDGGPGRGNSGRTVSQDPGRADPHPRQLRQAGAGRRRGACRGSSRGKPNRRSARERPPRAGPLGRVAEKPAHRSGDRQSRLAVAFRRGLVRTPSNFGMLSEPPSHPKLLDWLAARFVEDGWSLKKLHRRIMLSAAYRRSSVAAPRADRPGPR